MAIPISYKRNSEVSYGEEGYYQTGFTK